MIEDSFHFRLNSTFLSGIKSKATKTTTETNTLELLQLKLNDLDEKLQKIYSIELWEERRTGILRAYHTWLEYLPVIRRTASVGPQDTVEGKDEKPDSTLKQPLPPPALQPQLGLSNTSMQFQLYYPPFLAQMLL